MAKTTTYTGAVDTNWLNPANWSNGVPAAGDIVLDPTGSKIATITGLSLVNEQITLSGSGQFMAVAGSSLDAATTITGTTDSNAVYFDGTFSTAATLTNLNINLTGNVNFTNTGTILYNRAPLAAPNFLIGTGDLTANDVNSGTITVMSQAGAATTSPNGSAPFPTYLTINAPLAGTGVVNVIGGFPSGTAIPTGVSGTQAKVVFGSPVTGSNTVNLNDGIAYFEVIASATVNFQDAVSILDLSGNNAVSDAGLTVTGFRAGDVIGLNSSNIVASSLSYNQTTHALSFGDNAGHTFSLTVLPTGTQTYSTASFSLANNGFGDFTTSQAILTNAAAPCYCPGTAILTDRGEVAVEDLAIGDRVITLDGSAQTIRWVGRRTYDGRFIEGRRDILPVCITAGAFADNLPRRDLFVSPLHAMYIAGGLVLSSALVNGVSIVQAESVESVEYIHIELDQHGVIWAEGAASETFVDDDSRGMFHNAADFTDRYPDAVRADAIYCAPRFEGGELLETVKRAIDERAGLRGFMPAPKLRGQLDAIDGLTVLGWAQNLVNPEAPVCVELVINDAVVDRGLATVFRPDLRQAGLGSGYHGFRLALPPGDYSGRVEVRRAGDGAQILPARGSVAA